MRLRLLFAMAATAGIAACGSGGTSYPTGSNGTGGNGGMNGNTTGVTIVDYAFSPDTITVKAGSSVTWTNSGSVAHTSTSDGGVWDSGQLSAPSGGGGYGGASAGGSFSHTFSATGTFTYHCANHTYMTGAVVVTP